MRKTGIFVAGTALAAALFADDARAFCGFYVGGADAKLFNNATQVVMMREGTRTVLSMQNDYQGPPEGFAMVVPVPVVLQKDNVKTLPKDVFDRVDKLTAPRLVEYWEQDPCQPPMPEAPRGAMIQAQAAMAPGAGGGGGNLGVTVEAKYSVGEYEIVILSAKDAAGLETWLKLQKYKIPEGAEPYLRPYVQSGSKFFVAKVDPAKVKVENGHVALSPLRFHYDTPELSLPVRLGLINSSGTQDLIVNVLAQNQRFEPANYPSVTIPTNLDVAEDAQKTFGSFYASLFDETLKKNPKAIVTEYAWDASTCDPCPGPALMPDDFATLGADVIPNQGPPQPTVQVELAKTGPRPDVVDPRPQMQWMARSCWATALAKKPGAKGGRLEVTVAEKKGGGVTATVGRNDTGDQELSACVKRAAENAFRSGIGTSTAIPVAMTLGSAVPPKTWGWTITRLHARYTKDALGQDIVFRAAKPITGGREVRSPMGDLEHGSADASMNNFQGRYAIRHPWTGPIACANPVRGIWGGPPSGRSQPIAAEKIAFAPRGGTNLVGFLRSDVPELGITGVARPLLAQAAPSASASAMPAPPADAGPPAPPPEAPKGGCAGCAVAPNDAPPFWALFATCAAAIGLAVRARRR